MKTIISIAALLFLIFNGVAQQVDYPRLKADAERAYAEGSYAKANELYSQADQAALPKAEARWVEFRVADTLWRAQAATETADTTKYEKARTQLEELIRVADKEEDRRVRLRLARRPICADSSIPTANKFWLRRMLCKCPGP